MEMERVPNTYSSEKDNKKAKNNDLQRMTAHEYEKKIHELLETIDILESRILLLNNQKGYAVTKLKDYEEKNDDLKKNMTIKRKKMKN